MGVELFGLGVKNYRSLSYYDDACYKILKSLGFPVLTYGKTDFLETIDSDKAIGFMLSDKHYLTKIIKKNNKNSKALFFYMNGVTQRLCDRQKITIALPPYELQEKLGNKLFLQNICQQLGIETNKTLSINFSRGDLEYIYKKCKTELGTPFIIQGDSGVSGEDTFKIKSFKELAKLTIEINGNFRASKYLKSIIPLSVHICITKKEILYEGPYIQVIGFKKLTTNPFQFSGNDTNQGMLSKALKKKIKFLSIKLASYANELGYRGILGIDFIWNKSEKKVYVQEINSRLVGLTRLLTGIQMEQKIIPHLIKHINEFLPTKSLLGYTNKSLDLSKNHYSQLYISNNKDTTIEAKRYLIPGIYKVENQKLIRTRDSLFVSDMKRDDVLINFSAYKGSKLNPEQIIAKIILKKSVLDGNNYALSRNTVKLITLIRNFVTN